MITARIEFMDKIPETCAKCDLYNWIYRNCHILDRNLRSESKIDAYKERRKNRPLAESEENND